MHGHTDNFTFLTQAPIHRVILTMSAPTIISMLVTSLYNVADTFFVGQINTQATAAVGVVFSMMFFVQAVGFFFGHGSGNFISRELGARRQETATKMASTGFFLSFFSGVVILLLAVMATPFQFQKLRTELKTMAVHLRRQQLLQRRA